MKKIWLYLSIVLLWTNSPLAAEILKMSAPPSIWAQQQGDKLTGPIVDLVEDLFREHNITVVTQVLLWARAITHMKSGKLDLIPVIFHTEERAAFMAFTVPYIEVPTAVFVPAGKSFSFEKIEDLKGKRGLMMRGDSISPEFEAFESQLSLTKLANYEQVFKMLADHRAEYAVVAQFGFMIAAKREGYDDKLERLPVPIASRSLYCAFSKKSVFVKYLPAVNLKIKQMQTEGTMQRMLAEAIRLAVDREDR